MAQRLHIVEEKFLKTIKENNLINENDVIVIGVSGGPDSITLLTCLNKYRQKLRCKIIVAHINHLIREDSTKDEEFVENVCKELDIPFYSKKSDILKIAEKEKRGTEEVGRKVRYNFFDEVAEKEKANKIAIAHNMNDNAETVLLNLIRGSGLNGLEGIQPAEYNKYIRPLINCTRAEIEDYCTKFNLKPRIDSTNKENIYRRNIIRNELIPYLEKINPSIVQTLNRTSSIIRNNNDYIKKMSDERYNTLKNTIENAIYFETDKFNNEDLVIRENIVLRAIKELKGDTKNIEKANIDDIILMAEKKIGNKKIKICKNLTISIYKNAEMCYNKSVVEIRKGNQ